MKTRRWVFAAVILGLIVTFCYFYICAAFFVSDEYTILSGSSLKASLPRGFSCYEALEAGTGGKMESGIVDSSDGERKVTLKVFNIIPVKEVSVTTVESPKVYPSGECIGVKLFSKGIIVTGFGDFETENGICVSPGAVAGLKTGDIIVAINSVETSSIAEFASLIGSREECVLTVRRGNRIFELNVRPEEGTDRVKRMGVYVKNSIAGVGTMTFSCGNDGKFAALGHGIADSESGILLPLGRGSLYKAEIINIRKGAKGTPGEIIGALAEDKIIGECTANNTGGIYGVLYNKNPKTTGVDVAPKGEVTEGNATIICTVERDAGRKEYDIEITSVSRLKPDKSKSFSIKVTDEDLIAKTGGIVQGMSGSPVIQNGKLVGAVTHVFVNDPTRGYGIFIENMLEEANKYT